MTSNNKAGGAGGGAAAASSTECVKVAVRCRPMNKKENGIGIYISSLFRVSSDSRSRQPVQLISAQEAQQWRSSQDLHLRLCLWC